MVGSPNAFERLEGDHCVCANEVTSKLLLSVVGRASNDPVPSNGGSTVDISDLDSGMSTVVVPLASLGDIAEELVQDRRLMTREAVRFAFIEMTKRHHAMTNNNALTRSESASDHSSRSHSKDQLRQLEGEIKRLQEEHEKEAKKWRNEKDNIINEMIRRHQAEIVAMREKATQQQDDFTLRLDSYKKASCQAIGHLWKKNRKRPFC